MHIEPRQQRAEDAVGFHQRMVHVDIVDGKGRDAKSPMLAEDKANDLIDALELIGMVRIRNQAAQIEAGKQPDNYVQPEKLTSFERRHLKDAFHIASRMQDFLKYRYTVQKK